MVSERAKLPDFLEALNTQTSPSPHISPLPLFKSPPGSPNRPSSQTSLSASKLRYAAYDPPQAVHRFSRPSGSQRSYSGSSRSGTYSDHGGIPEPHRRLSVASEERSPLDELSRTVTAGDLTLAAGDIELELMAKVSPSLFIELTVADGDSDSASRIAQAY
jgi:AP-4 complex subunit epsilon-1